MLSSSFGDDSTAEAAEFRDRVLQQVRAAYPGIPFEAPPHNPGVIVANGNQFGLRNLKVKFDQSDRSPRAFAELVASHFSLVLQADLPLPEFDAARRRLRPQIMPSPFADKAPLISFPLGSTLAIGIVLDGAKGYQYLRWEDALRWNKSHRELLDLSLTNLDEASGPLQAQANENEEVKLVAIATRDGFDAARILVPALRESLANRLGSPFCFGVPNRDCLICWNLAASPRIAAAIAAQLRKDFQTQPYPLSPNVFQVNAAGVIKERA